MRFCKIVTCKRAAHGRWCHYHGKRIKKRMGWRLPNRHKPLGDRRYRGAAVPNPNHREAFNNLLDNAAIGSQGSRPNPVTGEKPKP